MRAISLDIETLDTTASAVVLSIGAVVVTPTGIQKEFYATLRMKEQLESGRTIGAYTLGFWLNQPKEVQDATFAEEGSVIPVLTALRMWAACNESQSDNPVPVYVKGPQFDAAIIDHLADTAGVERPIHYRRWRDLRTLEEMLRWAGQGYHLDQVKADRKNNHNALDDAREQGEIIRYAMNWKLERES